MIIIKEGSEKEYGHANPEALFPLFESDKEFKLIREVIEERFRGRERDIKIMYKYLASQHMPKFVIFSEELPYGIVIKRLTPEQAWSEVFCNKILKLIHFYDFNVVYHYNHDCISERYLYGYDIHQIPERVLEYKHILKRIFFWLGKCAAVAYVFGIGDRGHNERFNLSESNDAVDLFSYVTESEPIINIDFETFPSNRLTNFSIDVSEVAITFYAVYRQIPKRYINELENFFELFCKGFIAKLYDIKEIWRKNKKKFYYLFRRFFKFNPLENQHDLIRIIYKRANQEPPTSLFKEVFKLIEKEINKKHHEGWKWEGLPKRT